MTDVAPEEHPALFVTDSKGVTEIRVTSVNERPVENRTVRRRLLLLAPAVALFGLLAFIIVGTVTQIVHDDTRPTTTAAPTPLMPPGTFYSAGSYQTSHTYTTNTQPTKRVGKGSCLSAAQSPDIVPCDSTRAAYLVTGPASGIVCPSSTDAAFMFLPGGKFCAEKVTKN